MLTAALTLFFSLQTTGPVTPDNGVSIPSTSIPSASGTDGHTNHLELTGQWEGSNHIAYTGPSGFAPSSIRAAYHLNITNTSGAGTAIAIVDAYHYATAVRDFNVFSTQFGLPLETGSGASLSVVYQGTRAPATNRGWNQESALDIEWAHAIAPGAKIYLVEANSSSLNDLLATIRKAATLPGVRAVSMSWSSNEFTSQAGYDSTFTTPNVTFFASTGDTGGATQWPAMSRNVVAVGGTTLKNSGGWIETGWGGSGGGVSRYTARPTYQNGVAGMSGSKRNGPDISAVADPHTGVAVYAPSSATASSWVVFGGTSLSCPLCTAMYDLSGHVAASSFDEHTLLYQNANLFNDIIAGSASVNHCVVGYDRVTGLGTPNGLAGF